LRPSAAGRLRDPVRAGAAKHDRTKRDRADACREQACHFGEPDAVLPVTGQPLRPNDARTNVAASRLPKVSSDADVRPILIKRIPKFPEVILYDQLDNPGVTSWTSQEFPDLPEFTSFLADDLFAGRPELADHRSLCAGHIFQWIWPSP
jgi:hypothetical protein